jgi:uncharacterized phiE125 gp8 family phage protein
MGANGPGTAVLGASDRAAVTGAVKALLGLNVAEQDGLIATLGESALGLAEAFIGQVLIARPITETIEGGRCWARLVSTPVSAITAVAAFAADGTTAPLAPDAYLVDIDANGDGWVRSVGGHRLAVSLSAGMAADWGSLPPAIRQGTAMLAAYLYDHRDGAAAPPAAVTALWRPFRRMRLDARVPA